MIRRSRSLPLALALSLALVATGCGDDGGDDASSATTSAAPATTSTEPGTTAPPPQDAVTLAELQIVFVEFGDAGYVEIENRGATDADLAGTLLVQGSTSADLGTLVAGGTLAAGTTTQVAADTVGGLSADGGEVALFQGDAFDAASLLSYVQWGAGGGAYPSVAADAGIWPGPEATVTVDPAFNSIELGGDPADPVSWE
jgi:hypothetical protein